MLGDTAVAVHPEDNRYKVIAEHNHLISYGMEQKILSKSVIKVDHVMGF